MSVNYTPRTETVWILQGDDEEELRQLRAFADSLRPKKGATAPAPTMDEPDPTALLAEAEKQHDDFAAEARERGIKIVLRSIGRKAWREILAKHPARPDDENDQALGANGITLPEDLIPACMASPVFETDGQKADFLDNLSEGQFGHLGQVAWLLNTRTGADPKARLGSATTPS